MTELSKRAAFRLQSVMLAVTANPKKVGSASHERFEHYFEVNAKLDDYTVQDCLDAGVRMDDIMHDSAHGFILLGDEAILEYEEDEKERAARELERARELVAAADAK
jgi:hypothetical protein